MKLYIARFRFAGLLLFMFLFFILEPLLGLLDLITAQVMLNIFQTLILLAAVYAVSGKRHTMIIAYLLVAPTVLLFWASLIYPDNLLLYAAFVLSIVIYAFIATSILKFVLNRGPVTSQKIYGALCAYLLIGHIWAFIFRLFYTWHPGSLDLAIQREPGIHDFVYYSFVTLTTLGYGDITPIEPVARALSWIEAVIGQFYIAVVVARLVGLHIGAPEKKASPD